MLTKIEKNCSYDSRIVNHREIIGRLTSHKDSGASAQLSWQCRARKKAEDWKKKSEIMHICKYHLKDDKCNLKNICKVKHPKLQRYYQRISMHKLFCDQSGKIFLNDYGWMIWLSHDMTNSADLKMGIISPPQLLASACITHPLHLGVGVRGPTCCPIINVIVCLSLQAPPVYWKLHPGLCAPVLLQHTHHNKCNIATDYKVQKRGSVSQANFT